MPRLRVPVKVPATEKLLHPHDTKVVQFRKHQLLAHGRFASVPHLAPYASTLTDSTQISFSVKDGVEKTPGLHVFFQYVLSHAQPKQALVSSPTSRPPLVRGGGDGDDSEAVLLARVWATRVSSCRQTVQQKDHRRGRRSVTGWEPELFPHLFLGHPGHHLNFGADKLRLLNRELQVIFMPPLECHR